MSIAATTSLWLRLLGRPKIAVAANASGLTLKSRDAERSIPYTQLTNFQWKPGTFWGTLRLRIGTSDEVVVRCLAKRGGAIVAAAAMLWASRDRVAWLLAELDRPGGRDQYLTHSALKAWMNAANGVIARVGHPLDNRQLPRQELLAYRHLTTIFAAAEQFRDQRNRSYVQRQRERHASLFASGQGYALNDRQVESILHDEDRCLVVAGAGTGKTSTIVGKAAHVLREGLARPDEILLVAFTNKACDEMAMRLLSLTGESVAVQTFHALGLRIIAQASGKKPSLSKLAEDDQALRSTLQAYLTDIVAAEGSGSPAAQFLAYHRYPFRSPETFRSLHHYHQYVRGHDIRSLRGERLKSVEESMIANWLTLHGVAYEYERPYEHDTASVEFRQYRPDFYLPRYGIYLEHFGITRSGAPAPIFDNPEKYLAGMKWKRELHRRHGTRLIETCSYQVVDGSLLPNLAAALRAVGVPCEPVSNPEIRALLTHEDVVSPIVPLLQGFLHLYKGGGWTLASLMEHIDPAADPRAAVFLKVFEGVLSRYQADLHTEKAIDFSDMINEAASLTASGRFVSPYRYILVDEFQDISKGRARLIRAMLDRVPGSRLFCVGDDWQSIYRFTGSDIDLMTNFQNHFGFTRRTDLEITHRFGDRLLRASSQFILENPQQLRKSLRAARDSALPEIEVISTPEHQPRDDGLRRALNTIGSENQSDHIDVLVVGRYHFCLDDYRRAVPPGGRLQLRFMSVHQAKGLEADYCVVVGVEGGKYGFPTEITDDPLLELVLARGGGFPNAEERRVFYVAVTRARIKTFVLTQDRQRSVFADELDTPAYSGLVIPSGASSLTVFCPVCKGGRLLRRDGAHGIFWGCSNFPQCGAKARPCPWCGAGALVPGAREYLCANPSCKARAPVCPSCRVGAVIPKLGRFGLFYGCTEWRNEGPSCSYTRNDRPPQSPADPPR